MRGGMDRGLKAEDLSQAEIHREKCAPGSCPEDSSQVEIHREIWPPGSCPGHRQPGGRGIRTPALTVMEARTSGRVSLSRLVLNAAGVAFGETNVR